MVHEFEALVLDSCDSCGDLQLINEYRLCECCDAEGHAFKVAAGNAKLDGKTPHEQYQAGMTAGEQSRKTFVPQPVYAPHNPATLIALGKDA